MRFKLRSFKYHSFKTIIKHNIIITQEELQTNKCKIVLLTRKNGVSSRSRMVVTFSNPVSLLKTNTPKGGSVSPFPVYLYVIFRSFSSAISECI